MKTKEITGDKMKELKTLKDLDTFDKFMPSTDKSDFIDKEELKAEAVKWIEHWNVYNKELSPPPKNPMDEGGYAMMCGATGAFMDFFNLTEEELK